MNATIPATQRRLKYVATINDDALGEETDADFEIQYVDISNVDSSGNINELVTYRFEDAPSRARRRVRDGDVIISTVRTYLQAIAQITRPPLNLIASTGFAVVRPRSDKFDARYCKYALREPAFLAEVEKRSVGVSYPAINASDLASIPVHVHSLPRQRAIADYLDRETGRIDALIAAKERVLGLLAEKRRALITRAVTRGLDPHAPLRDSGIPWLGEIPAHWETRKLAFLAELKSGESITAEHIRDAGQYPVYGGNGLRGYTDRFTHEGEYVLIGRQGALCGNIHYASGQFWASEHAVVVAPRDVVAAHWLEELLRTMNLNQFSASAAQPGLAVETIAALKVPVPSLAEQRAIVEDIDRATANLDTLRAATERSIALLNERRAALIAAAVTGQIEVGAPE